MRKKAAQEQKVAELKASSDEDFHAPFTTWLDFDGVGSVGVTVYERDGVCLSVERLDGSHETKWLGEEKSRELHRVLSAYMEPREKARLQAEALAKLSPAERWALGLEEPAWERSERRRGR